MEREREGKERERKGKSRLQNEREEQKERQKNGEIQIISYMLCGCLLRERVWGRIHHDNTTHKGACDVTCLPLDCTMGKAKVE